MILGLEEAGVVDKNHIYVLRYGKEMDSQGNFYKAKTVCFFLLVVISTALPVQIPSLVS